MSRRVRQYLQYPDKLFRRVKGADGKLHLSKNAKAFHPGQGVYRSSYKNAMRLTRTETNAAYRLADQDRWQRMDFVVGMRVHKSNNHPTEDICDVLAGDYPKTFKFSAWHPQCRCYVMSILCTKEEMMQMQRDILAGKSTSNFRSVNEVRTVPKAFTDWVDANGDRIMRAKALPYFLKDNGKIVDGKWVMNGGKATLKETKVKVETRQEKLTRIINEQCQTEKDVAATLLAHNVCSEVQLGDLPLVYQKQAAIVLIKMQELYGLDPIALRHKAFPSRHSKTLMWACDKYIEMNSLYWGRSKIKKTITNTFDGCVTNYKDVLESNLRKKKKWYNNWKDWESTASESEKRLYAKEIKKAEKEYLEYKAMLDSGMSRHNVFLSGETMFRDCFTHETGHVIHDQLLGGLNSHLRKGMYKASDAAVLDNELKKLYRKHKKLGGGWLSKYGMMSHKEFLCESNVLYMFAPQKLPADVKLWFDNLVEYSKKGILPDKEKMPSVAFKKTKAKNVHLTVLPAKRIGSQKYIQESNKIYDSYREDWEKVFFDENTGGYNVYHKKHQFSETTPKDTNNKRIKGAITGGAAEKIVGENLARKYGERVEFCAENGKNKNKPDLLFGGYSWDVKYCEFANDSTLRSAFKNARKADRVIFYSPNIVAKLKSIDSIIERELGNYRKQSKSINELPDVYTMGSNGELRLYRKIKEE